VSDVKVNPVTNLVIGNTVVKKNPGACPRAPCAGRADPRGQTPPEETCAAVEAALATGYRHTAAAYGNEREVGEAVHSSGVGQGEIFIETKIWISDCGYDKTLQGFEKSGAMLGVDQIDLLILHQALPSGFDKMLEA
jgi:diketogulonate reductase-like aldo/keto reductase